jgi:ferredoxin
MCEICAKHAGQKNKWYFNPKNYSKEMGEARIAFLEKIAGSYFEEWTISGYESVEFINKIPLLNKIINNLQDKHYGKLHGAQVIPLNDVVSVLELCENPAVLPCVCQHIIGKEKYCCLTFGLLPELYKKANKDGYVEEISISKAKRLLSSWDQEGYYHLILWTKMPYVTNVCNCSNPYCLAYKGRFELGLKSNMYKGEYIAKVNQNLCIGCKKCLTICPFGATFFDLDRKKAFKDIRKCFGCGLCVTVCEQKANELVERTLTAAKNLW